MKFCNPKLICSLCKKIISCENINTTKITCTSRCLPNIGCYNWLEYYIYKDRKITEIRDNTFIYDIEDNEIFYNNLYFCKYFRVRYKILPIISEKSFEKIKNKLNLYFEKLDLLQ